MEKELAEQGSKVLGKICAAICCVLMIGPSMIGVGIFLLLVKSQFDDDVKVYQDAISSFKANNALLMGNTTAVLDPLGLNISAVVTNVTVPIRGVGADKVPVAYSVVVQFQSPIDTSFVHPDVKMTSPEHIATRRRSESTVSTPSSIAFDGPANGTTTCTVTSGSGTRACTTREWQVQCQSSYGVGVEYIGDRNCSWYQYWDYACIPLVRGEAEWKVDTSLGSCDYISLPMGSYNASGFGSQPLLMYAAPQPGMTNQHLVKFMANDDPYIVAMRITKGTMDFGPPPTLQHGLGLALIVVGALFLVMLVCLVCKIVRGAAGSGIVSHALTHGQAAYEKMPQGQRPAVPFNFDDDL